MALKGAGGGPLLSPRCPPVRYPPHPGTMIALSGPDWPRRVPSWTRIGENARTRAGNGSTPRVHKGIGPCGTPTPRRRVRCRVKTWSCQHWRTHRRAMDHMPCGGLLPSFCGGRGIPAYGPCRVRHRDPLSDTGPRCFKGPTSAPPAFRGTPPAESHRRPRARFGSARRLRKNGPVREGRGGCGRS